MWSNPAVGRITSRYGKRSTIKTSGGETATFHAGIDIAAPIGTPVHAAAGGRVIFAGVAGMHALTSGRSGLAVLIRHPSGHDTYYGHLHVVRVRVDQEVAIGQRIGDVGATGKVTGPHLHFEVRPRAGHIGTTDPLAFLATKGVRIAEDAPRPASRASEERAPLVVQVDGDWGRRTIAALQRQLAGVGKDVGPADGTWGPRSIRAWQEWLAQCGFDPGPLDGRMGRRTILAEQRWLRSHGLYSYGVDGVRGVRTIIALQGALNRGVIR